MCDALSVLQTVSWEFSHSALLRLTANLSGICEHSMLIKYLPHNDCNFQFKFSQSLKLIKAVKFPSEVWFRSLSVFSRKLATSFKHNPHGHTSVERQIRC